MIVFKEQPFHGVAVAQKLAGVVPGLNPAKITVTMGNGQITVDFGGQLTPAQETQALAVLAPIVQKRFGDYDNGNQQGG